MKELISIIIPVYNVQKYLDYCISSVREQEYSNIEIILVDDGSTDGSGGICDKYAGEDSRIRVIHKENGGLSSARNAGMTIMKGEYFTFIDSDDYIRADYLSRMHECIKDKKVDMVICRAKKTIGEEDYSLYTSKEMKPRLLNAQVTKNEMLNRRIPMYAHGKLFQEKLAKSISFPEGRLYEDMPTIWNVVKRANMVAYLEEELYYYRQRIDSIVNSQFKAGRMDQCYFSEEIVNEVKDTNELYYSAVSLCFFCAMDNYSLITNKFKKEKEYLIKLICKYRNDILKGKGIEGSLKFLALLSFFSLKLVQVIGKAYKLYNHLKWKVGYWRHRVDEKSINFKK